MSTPDHPMTTPLITQQERLTNTISDSVFILYNNCPEKPERTDGRKRWDHEACMFSAAVLERCRLRSRQPATGRKQRTPSSGRLTVPATSVWRERQLSCPRRPGLPWAGVVVARRSVYTSGELVDKAGRSRLQTARCTSTERQSARKQQHRPRGSSTLAGRLRYHFVVGRGPLAACFPSFAASFDHSMPRYSLLSKQQTFLSTATCKQQYLNCS